ncbi:MAG: hypothetical protein ABR575_07170 [Actinomycetota bacterium]
MSSTRWTTALAWGLWAVGVAGSTATFVFASASGDREERLFDFVLFSAIYVGFATVGALIAARRPGNAIGWLLIAIGSGAALGNATQEYAMYALDERSGALPGGIAMAWFGAWLWPGSVALLVFLLLLFPDGKPASRRWRPVVWAAAAGWLVLMAGEFFFKPGPLDLRPLRVENPLGIEAAREALELAAALGGGLLLLCVVAAVGSLVLRARRSTGDERQQFKWFAYAAAFMVFDLLVLGNVMATFFPRIADAIGNLMFGLGIVSLPAAIGIAVLKYHLYDIDVIVNRTLVYGALSAILALAYAGIVFALQALLPATASDSNFAIAGSTLAVAALFTPLRRRIQAFIDHRFYRRKYDAERTVERFRAHLRDEVDLDSLSAHLLEVVDQTMQPASVSLWLRAPDGVRQGGAAIP